MKILDIPQSGKRGPNVSLGGRFGQTSREMVIPTDPRTGAQLRVRRLLSDVASKWRTLTQAQRDAWTTEASQHKSKPRLGQSGPLTGCQLWAKINCARLMIGGDEVSVPPAAPIFAILPISGLVITNTADVITLKLTTTGAPPDGTMLWGAKPCSQGRSTARGLVFLGVLGSPGSDGVDISSGYKARFGSPKVGSKVFVRVNQNIHGWEDIPSQFWAIVPAAT